MANRFQSEFHEGWLSQPFILNLACRRLHLTEAQIEKAAGRYIRGAHRGQLRGKLTWHKVVKGGWVKTGAYDWDTGHGQGYVIQPGVTYAYKLFLGCTVLFEDGVDERFPRMEAKANDKPILTAETPVAVRNLAAAEEARKVLAAGGNPADLVAYLQKFIQDNS